MTPVTVLGKLVAKATDVGNYTTYVFELLDNEDKRIFNTKYIMMIRYPNWDSAPINIDSVGYVKCIEVIAGEDKYYKEGEWMTYNQTNIQFIKFVPQDDNNEDSFIIVD